MASNIRKGSKVQFKVGRGVLTGKVLEISDKNIATVKGDETGNEYTRKLALLYPANG